MANEKKSILYLINPVNYKLGTKIHFLIFSSVLLAVLLIIFLGFFRMRKTVIRGTTEKLEELSYLKLVELEDNLQSTFKDLYSLSTNDKLIRASQSFNDAYKSLRDERYDLFYIDSMTIIKSVITQYYDEEYASNCPLSVQEIHSLIPQDQMTLLSQYLFICSLNGNISTEKKNEIAFGGGTTYSSAHASYHPYLREIAARFKASDVYLVNPLSGEVVYTLNKNIDFGTNLYEGKLAGSALSTAFRKALASNHASVSYVDFSHYVGAFDKAVAFFSIPIVSYNNVVSVLILQIDTKFFDTFLNNDYLLAKAGTLEYNLIGGDMKIRNNPRGFLENADEYVNSLRENTSGQNLDKIILFKKLGSMALIANYPANYRDLLKDGPSGRILDYNGNEVLAWIRKFNICDTELFLVTKIDKTDSLSYFSKQMRFFILLIVLILIVIFFIGNAFSITLKGRITLLRDSLNQLHNGEQPKALDRGSPDELGDTIEVYNGLRKRINEASEFAIEMSEGNFNHEFAVLSEVDSLGKSLNILKQKMIHSRDEQQKRDQEDEITNWINVGIAKFNDLLRQSNDDINALSYLLIENLTAYLGAVQGGVFIVEGDSEADRHISLQAAYAYDRRKYQKKRIEMGDGLLGNVYLEKKSVYLKDIPQDYIEVRSGLGQSQPRCLYIVPLKIDEVVLGMIELASFNEFKPYQIDFIEKVSDSIAATFVGVRLNMQTTRLLDESNRKAEEIAQQEEEMRQNMEEMQATQEELARLRQDDEKKTRDLQVIIDSTRRTLKNLLDAIPGGYVVKDQNGIIHYINDEGAAFYGLPAESLRGRNEHEFLSTIQLAHEEAKDKEVLESGLIEYKEEKTTKGSTLKYNVIRKLFLIDELNKNGILTIRNKV